MLCRRNASTNITTLVSSHHSCVVVDINTGHLTHGHNQTKSIAPNKHKIGNGRTKCDTATSLAITNKEWSSQIRYQQGIGRKWQLGLPILCLYAWIDTKYFLTLHCSLAIINKIFDLIISGTVWQATIITPWRL